ncbi:MFS monocarboxylate transporter [Sporothrix brasiliensis 5110]|uniref:MFS monocarboxylate transporter n=1 Tax=Sporothrix brasiliensis 5110 TaxID=1398154 RepID=A0A0C2IH29_9PEZI|nr:MFS monocarboxylate transporter [Sporothrix brasiliensis 5110]KIH86325.1 MFS monocarboxylate transporter [Sporothrix brasiliensis 5110]
MADEKKSPSLGDSHPSSDEATLDADSSFPKEYNGQEKDAEEASGSANTAETDAPSPLSEFGPAPDGGWRAWTVAIGAGFITFAALGFANSFGVFQEYYITHQLSDKSADTIAWIGSCTAFFQFLAGSISGPLFDRYGAWLIRPATLVCVFAAMMISLCTEYYQFLLAQGFLLGMSSGAMQFPAMAAVIQFFDKKRAAALGVAVAGSSVGGVVFPIALSRMLNDPVVSQHLSFGWSVRIVGFVMLVSLGISCVTVRPRLPPRTTQFFVFSAFKQPTYVCVVVSMFFLFLGLFTPLFFLPSYAVSQGMDTTLASYLLAIVNAASTFGRIIPGILADKLGRVNALAAGGIGTGIVILTLEHAHSTAGLVVWALAFGFSSGTIVSGASAAISICSDDPRNMGTYLGMGLGAASIAVLIGPPINGQLLHHYATYTPVTIFSGVTCLVGGFIAFAGKMGTKQGLFGLV